MDRDDSGNVLTNGVSAGIRYLKRKKAGLGVAMTNLRTSHQNRRIKRFFDQDECILIIFDSCRFDYFQELYHNHFSGELTKVYNTNTYTKQYQRATWTGSYDITYVAGGPVITDRNFELSDLEYRPSEHFEEIVHAWNMGYSKELGVTPPEAVTEVALNCDAPRMIVHYFQPHAPYIGEHRHREELPDIETGSDEKIERRQESILDIYDKIESGQISEDELREVYISNLRRVLEATKPLVAETDRPIVITSDHGELLGEDGRYLHGGLPHRVLCELPWFEIKRTVGGKGEIDAKSRDENAVNDSIKEQLQALGYA